MLPAQRVQEIGSATVGDRSKGGAGPEALEPTAVEATLMRSILRLCGEFGYREVSIDQICDASRVTSAEFSRHFDSKSVCFLAAYRREATRFSRLVETHLGAEGEIPTRLEAMLEELALFINRRPAQARSLLLEVHLAGPAVVAQRRRLLDRLARMLDEVCRGEDTQPPPPITAPFMVGAVDHFFSRALIAGETADLVSTVPALVELTSTAFEPLAEE
jgi:AcrR family transcriptional regulator